MEAVSDEKNAVPPTFFPMLPSLRAFSCGT